ncbi:MAG: four helix bundle protein [Planctomycetaceae bacterium]|nr:four helix bundle protein [Planctomycetaceae bacterium]
MTDELGKQIDKRDLQKRTMVFAHRCMRLCSALPENWRSHHVRSQLIRCATSVAANYRAACISQSKPSFISKLGVVVEECDEATFWIEFIVGEEILTLKQCSSLLKESKELTSIFAASQKTARSNRKLEIGNRKS